MKSKLLLTCSFVLLAHLAGLAYDQNLGAPEITMAQGSIGYFQIDLEDDELTVGFDGEIELPDGFAVPAQEDTPNRTQYVLNYSRNEKLTFDAAYPYKDKEGYPKSYYNDVRLILMTSDNSYIKGKTGWIVKLPMTTTAEVGTYEARLHTIHLTTKTFNSNTNQTIYSEVDLPEIKVKITVTEPEEIRYSDNQLFCKDIEINQGENAELKLFYNSSSDVYEYSTDIVLPTLSKVDGEIIFSNTLEEIENFTNRSSWNNTTNILTVSGVYGGGRRDVPAPAGVQEIASINLLTASLTAGEYQIRILNQMLSNDDDITPEEYIGKLIVKSNGTLERCSTPTISIIDNQLYVHSDTEGAIYHTSIVAYDHKDVVHREDEPIELGGQYLITTYASAEGYSNSETTTATLIWNKEDVSTSVDFDITMDMTRILLLQSYGNNIVISGFTADESVTLYDISGSLLYQGNANSETFIIPFTCIAGHIYIVKVGSTSFKYLF